MKRGEDDSVQLGTIEIVLPTAAESQCYIFRDLTELLGVEFNSEALDKFKSEWKKRRKRGRLDVDCVLVPTTYGPLPDVFLRSIPPLGGDVSQDLSPLPGVSFSGAFPPSRDRS